MGGLLADQLDPVRGGRGLEDPIPLPLKMVPEDLSDQGLVIDDDQCRLHLASPMTNDGSTELAEVR
jgi:hypothetical protein